MQGLRRLHAQVIVVGGGPVGMLVAAELAAYGVDTVLLESQVRVSERPKATTLHARAVQSLVRRGHLAGPVAPSAGPGGGASPFHFAGLPGLLIAAPETEPQPILKCPQAELERLFEGRARAAGARILREHRVTETVQDRDGVRVTAEGPQGPVTCAAQYVVGADGARGTVREQAGITSDTWPATVASLMGTVTLTDPDVLSQGWLRTDRGWIVTKRDPGAGCTSGRSTAPAPMPTGSCRPPWRTCGGRCPGSPDTTSRWKIRAGSAGSATSPDSPGPSGRNGSS